MKELNLFSVAGGIIGGLLTFLFGGFDKLLYSLIALIVIDYVTGITKGVFTKSLSSKLGAVGIYKKILVLVIIVVAVLIQNVVFELTHINVPLREPIIVFFICNEGISILENAAEFIPIPDKLKRVLLQLRKSNDSDEPSEMGGGAMTFDEFVKKYLGKATDIDGVSGVQCVDLAKMYIEKVLGIKPQSIGNAHAYYDDFNDTYLRKYFKRIPYKKGVKSQKGDLVVWGRIYNGTSKYGHIAIATGMQTDTHIRTYDQNWKGKAMKEVNHSLDGIAGFLRPFDRSGLEKQYFIPDATVKSDCVVYSDNKLSSETGRLEKGERVKIRFKGRVLAIVQYNIKDGYKVGLVSLNNLKPDK